MTVIDTKQSWRKNIFLDFMNPDVRRVAGAYKKYNYNQHIQEIIRGIKIASLLGDRLILPPSFVLQCPLVRSSLNQCQILLKKKIILFPMRESDPNIFYEKKTQQYESVRNYYKDIHKNFGLEIIQKHNDAFVQRSTHIGKTISNYWYKGDLPTIKWQALQEVVPQKYDNIRKLPKRLVENNVAITAPAIQNILGNEILGLRDEIDLILQGIYGVIYLDEFEATSLTNLPIQQWDFGLPEYSYAYNYLMFRDVLNTLGLFKTLINLNFKDICLLRLRSGYLNFIKSYVLLSNIHIKDDLLLLFSNALRNKKKKVHKPLLSILRLLPNINTFDSSMVEALDDFFFEISECLHLHQLQKTLNIPSEIISNYSNNSINFEPAGKQSTSSLLQGPSEKANDFILGDIDKRFEMRIMIFSALKEELDYLLHDKYGDKKPIARLFQWSYDPEHMFYRSFFQLDTGKNIEVFLVTPDEAGLTPTAILTSRIISIIKPHLSIMIGICGGRHSEHIELTDILMPYQSFLYSYGAYKNNRIEPEIRVEKVGKKISNWATHVLKNNLITDFYNHFPAGTNKPRTISRIRKEPMGCGDLVVKDISIIDDAAGQDRKVVGVDMESYAFLRAVGNKDKVLILKAVSDFADRNKNDQFRDYCNYITASCTLALIQKINDAPVD